MNQNHETRHALQDARDKCISIARALSNAAASPMFNPFYIMDLANDLERLSSSLFFDAAGIAAVLQEVE